MRVTSPILYGVPVILVWCVFWLPLLARAQLQDATTVWIKQNGSDSLDCVSKVSSNLTHTSCQTLEYALTHVAMRTNVIFSLDCGEHLLENDISVANFSNLAIVSDCLVDSTTFVCTNGSSLAFHQCSGIDIDSIVFKNCGPNELSVHGSALLFSSSQNIVMTNVTVVNSTYRGITFLDVFGTNKLISLIVDGTNGGSGLYFEFENSECPLLNENNDLPNCPTTHYAINKSVLQNCKATTCTEASSSCMGGGIAIVFKGSVGNVQMNFSESVISNNEAMLAGGGAFVRFLGRVDSNDVYFWRTEVMNNFIASVNVPLNIEPRENCEAWTSGGGIAVLFSNSSKRNGVHLLYATIVGNAANSGGGLAATFQGTSTLNSVDVRFSNISSNTVTSVRYDNPCIQISSRPLCTGNGGGLALAFIQEARNNVAQIYSSDIVNNSYTEIGGGYSVVWYDQANLNAFYGVLNVVDRNRMANNTAECEDLFGTQLNTARLVPQPSGGGGCLIFLGHSNTNFVALTESFSRNTAVRGGGLFVGFYNLTSMNAIVTSGLIHDNWLEGGTQRSRSGGGAMVEYKTSHKSNFSGNSVQFSRAMFLRNNCSNSFGGAVAILYNSPPINVEDAVVFGASIFSNNSCRYGRAVAATTVKRYSQSANLNIVFFDSILVNILEDSFRNEFEAIDNAILSHMFSPENPEEHILGILFSNGLTVLPLIENIIKMFTIGDYHVPEFYVRDLSDLQELLQDGQGLVYLRSVTMQVASTLTVFCGGLSQGIFAVDSTITFLPSSNLVIERCTATHGGAMALYDDSFLSVFPGANLTFYANRALQRGGAVYVRTSPADVSRVPTCFLQHGTDRLVPPAQWKDVHIVFINNTADVEGSSIYVLEGLTCLPSKLQDTIQIETSNILLWDNVFTYIPPSCGPSEVCIHPHVSSGPHEMVGNNNETIANADFTACDDSTIVNHSIVSGSPGDLISLPIGSILDIFNNNSSTNVLPSISAKQNDVSNDSGIDISIDGQIRQRRGNRIRLNGQPFQDWSIELESVPGKELPQILFQAMDNGDLFAFFDVVLECCPPGFQFNKTSLRCQCDRKGLGDYLDTCEVVDGFQAKLKSNYWFGYQKSATGCNGEELYYSPCPYSFCSGKPLLLPSNRSSEHLDELICGSSNRKGTVCGQCKEGFAMPINFNLVQLSCQNCHESLSYWGLVVWILSEWLPMLVVVMIILLFNVDMFDGRFNAFLLCVQILPQYLGRGLINNSAFEELGVVSNSIAYYVILVCNVWNLDFFGRWLPPFCLTYGSTLSILQVFTISFVIGLAPLCLVCLFVLLDCLGERCCKPMRVIVHTIRNFKVKYCGSSKYDKAIPTIYILSFARAVVYPAVMGRMNFVRNAESNETMRVLFYDGSIDYLSAEHIYYWIPIAVTSAFILVPPTLCLVLYPTLPMMFDAMKNSKYKCLNWVQRLKLVDRCVHGIFSIQWMRHFLDVCQSSFKPKYRFFASLFVLQRILFMGIAQAFLESGASLILLMAMMIFMIMMISIFQPYRQRAHSAIDLILLWILTVVIALNLYGQGNEVNVVFQLLLGCLPCIYVACIIAFAVLKLIKPCAKKCREKTFCTKANNLGTAHYNRHSVALTVDIEQNEKENDSSDGVVEVSWRAKSPVGIEHVRGPSSV